MPKNRRVYPKVVKTHDNFIKSSYANKRVSSALYQNSSINQLLQINKLHVPDEEKTFQKCVPILEENLISEEKTIETGLIAKENKVIQKVEKDRLKNFPFVFCGCVVIIQGISGIIEICLQTVLLLRNTPLNIFCGGIWSGVFALLVSFTMTLILIKRKYRFYIASMILNFMAIFVFIALAIINNLSIILYDNCSECLYEKEYRWVNYFLMSLAFVSFICSIFYLFQAQDIIS